MAYGKSHLHACKYKVHKLHQRYVLKNKQQTKQNKTTTHKQQQQQQNKNKTSKQKQQQTNSKQSKDFIIYLYFILKLFTHSAHVLHMTDIRESIDYMC